MSDTRTNDYLLRIARAVICADGLGYGARADLMKIEQELMALQSTGQFPQLNTKMTSKTGKGKGGKKGGRKGC